MDEKDIKCGASTLVKMNREIEDLRSRVDKLESGEVDDLAGMTKDQLVVVAETIGVDVDGLKKADMIAAIEEAQSR